MNIILDQQIPYLAEWLQPHAEVTSLASEEINASSIQNADALFVRTTVKVNQALLQNSSVKFVGSGTAGFDHIDQQYLQQAGITWTHAPGCNAAAVVQYVLACLDTLESPINSVGIIGVGHVGSLLASVLNECGYQVVLNDPPREQQDPSFISASLEQALSCDVVSLHASLNPTSYHLINADTLRQLKNNTVLINAARGELINEVDFLSCTKNITACFDVFEHEPDINTAMVEQAFIATPHIAGYSKTAKQRASLIVFNAAAKKFGWPVKEINNTDSDISTAFDIKQLSNELRQQLLQLGGFLRARRSYQWR